jgi:hypothetical protein
LASIVGETDGGDDPFTSRERRFVQDYILNTDPDTVEAARIRKLVEKGSRRFLEKQ